MSRSPEIIIERTRGWVFIDLTSVWNYRDLLFMLVKREFISKYKRTALGPIWFVLQPLITTYVFALVFGHVAKIPTEGIHPTLFYLCGLIPWSYFAQCTEGTATSLTHFDYLIEKVYFPRIIVPLSIIISKIFNLLIHFCLFLIFYTYLLPAGEFIPRYPYLLLLPFLIIQTALTGLGIGLWMAAITVRYRDLHHLIGFFLNLCMYLTPVIYPLSIIPQKWRIWMALNPLAENIETYRYAFFGTGSPDLSRLMLSGLVTFLTLFSGLIYFGKEEKNFVDTL